MNAAAAVLLLLLAVGQADDNPRPSAAVVAAHVDDSRERNLPTKEQHLAKLRKLIDLAVYERDHPDDRTPRRGRGKRFARVNKEIAGLRADLKEAETSWAPPRDSVELSRIDWAKLQVGAVGRGTRRGGGSFRCLRVLGPESALVTILDGGDELTVVRIDGRSTASDQEGLACEIECDLVVTGRYRHGARNVFVLEVFNPGQPFK